MVPQLHQALCNVQSGSVSATLSSSNRLLSSRQNEILQLVAQGKTNREIAKQLSRAESTIRNHVHTILQTLGVANRAEAAARLMQIR